MLTKIYLGPYNVDPMWTWTWPLKLKRIVHQVNRFLLTNRQPIQETKPDEHIRFQIGVGIHYTLSRMKMETKRKMGWYSPHQLKAERFECVIECVSAWVRECVSAWVRECVSAWVRECVSAWVRECVSAWVRECVSAWVREWVGEWASEWPNERTNERTNEWRSP